MSFHVATFHLLSQGGERLLEHKARFVKQIKKKQPNNVKCKRRLENGFYMSSHCAEAALTPVCWQIHVFQNWPSKCIELPTYWGQVAVTAAWQKQTGSPLPSLSGPCGPSPVPLPPSLPPQASASLPVGWDGPEGPGPVLPTLICYGYLFPLLVLQ